MFIGLKLESRDDWKSIGSKLGHRNDFAIISLRHGFFFLNVSFTQTEECWISPNLEFEALNIFFSFSINLF